MQFLVELGLILLILFIDFPAFLDILRGISDFFRSLGRQVRNSLFIGCIVLKIHDRSIYGSHQKNYNAQRNQKNPPRPRCNNR